jgi:flagellar biosynthesis/type III secretory pathway protein FliH
MNLLKEFEKDGIKKGRALGLQEGLERGLEKGLERGREEVALNLLIEGTPLELIVKTTGLTVPHILSLRTLH